jgi:hypothetical protein
VDHNNIIELSYDGVIPRDVGSKNRSHEKNNLFESIHTSVEYGVCLPKHATLCRSSTYILQLLQKLGVEIFSSIKLVSHFASSIIA